MASCRSREMSKSEMDRNGTILNDLIYSHLLHLLPLIGFPGISGPFERENEDTCHCHHLLYLWPRPVSPQHHRDPRSSQPHAKLWAPAARMKISMKLNHQDLTDLLN